MAIETTCPHCRKSFRLKSDNAVGRKVRCPGCSQHFVIQAKVEAPAPASPQSFAGEPITSDDSPYALNDLADAAASERQAQGQAPVFAPPVKPLRPVVVNKPKRSANYSDASTSSDSSSWLSTAITILVVIAAILYALSFAVPKLKAYYAIVMLLASVACYFWGLLGMLITPFREAVIQGLACCFVPFYGIYYLISRWGTMKWWFLRTLTGVILLIITNVSLMDFAEFKKEYADRVDAAKNQPMPIAPNRQNVQPAPTPVPASPRTAQNVPDFSARRQMRMIEEPRTLSLKSTPEQDAKLEAIARNWKTAGGYDLISALQGGPKQMENGVMLLPRWQRYMTSERFVPPVTFKAIVMNDNKDFRFGFAADEIIFNWEMRQDEFRVGGGPANGRHKPGAGQLPVGVWVGIEWVVKPDEMIVYVDGEERYRTQADFSRINMPLTVWSQNGVSALRELKVVK